MKVSPQGLTIQHQSPQSVSQSINCVCVFKPSQPLGTISGLKETFLKRCIVERTDKAETRPEEQDEKTDSYWENLWDEIQLRGP